METYRQERSSNRALQRPKRMQNHIQICHFFETDAGEILTYDKIVKMKLYY